MELSSFSENIVTETFERNGESVTLEINIDAFTPEFFRKVGKKFKERMKELEAEDKTRKPKKKAKVTEKPMDFFETEAKSLEISRSIHAELLTSGVLKGWDVTENGLPLAPNYEVLMRLPPLLVESIWNLALEKAKTVKKRVGGEIEATSENSPSGTRAPLALAPTG